MSNANKFPGRRVISGLRALFVAAALMVATVGGPSAQADLSAPLAISQTPLFIAAVTRPNVLLTVANSNSMDEDATGLAVGSAAPNSKSEIARRVARGLVTNYQTTINMGLMAFQQTLAGGDPVTLMQLHSSPYDASFDPADWDPTFNGLRTSQTKRFRAPIVGRPGNFIYYNVNLPFYSGGNLGNAYCYSPSARAFSDGEVLWGGPWDSYRCFTDKNNSSNALPAWGDPATEAAAGYGGALIYQGAFFPTDSDLGQGITDFGRFITWNWVSPTWFSNGSPGRGFIHVPIAPLDAAQMALLNTKLGTSQFAVNGPNNPALPLQNAGLTPLEGSLFTAREYFNGTLASATQGGPLSAPPNACGKNFVVLLTNGLPSVDKDGVPSSNVVSMLAATTAAAAALRADGVLTYVVGFALPFGVNPAQLDTIAAAGGTNTAYNATDEATLQSALDAVFTDIVRRSGAAAAVSLSSGSVQTDTRLYQARFDAGWIGQLAAYQIDNITGAISATADWEAGQVLSSMNYDTDRRILSFKPSGNRGIAFRWPANPGAPGANELDPSQVAALNTNVSNVADGRGATRLDYLRGDNSLEGPTVASQFRPRTGDLGDIVNSAPIYVGAPPRNLRDQDYFLFRTTPQVANRTPMVYVGANDGMLHGFRASDGRELLAYVPAAVYSNLSRLTAQSYTHQYFVDASPIVQDAKISLASPYWRTLLVSGLGGGGRGIFALDITNPSQFSEANAAQLALWEFTSAQDADLGLTFGQPAVVKANDGSWVAIAGNGLNNTGSGKSGIFVLNAATGALKRKILTSVGTAGAPNGIAGFTPVDVDGNGTVDYVYAGDVYGRVWKFDLTSNDPLQWAVGFGGSPLYRATVSGTDQPITVAPEVSRHPNGGLMIEFGTGMYLQWGDITSTTQQTVYGLRDNGVTIGGRSDLQAQSVTGVTTINSVDYRNVTSNSVDWNNKKGWFLDLPSSGERVAVDAVLRNGRLLVTTLIPNTDLCSAGGTSWLMALDYLSGGQSSSSLFDTNQDGSINNADGIVAGLKLSGIGSSAVILGNFGPEAEMDNAYVNQSTGTVRTVMQPNNPLSNRRMSWRQIR